MVAPIFIFGQNSRLNYANKQYEQLAYYYAIEAYLDVLERGTDSSEISSKIADCYFQLNQVENAVTWYDYINRKQELNKEQHIRLAMLKRQLANYDESLDLFISFQQKYGENDITKSMISEGEALIELLKNNGNFIIDKVDINTEASEMGVAYFTENQVLVASSIKRKNAVNRVYPWTGENYYNLYSAKIDETGKIQSLKPIKGEANTKFHDGPATYDKVNNYIYFTRDNFLKKKGYDENKTMRLKIYRGKLVDSKLTEVLELPFNSDNYSCGHPSVSEDGKVLYFVSDMPGGVGGTDVYSVSLENGIGSPINLGTKINTSQDEFFPFYHSGENILFFSSNGLFGLGGQDVFVAKLNKTGEVKNVQNLGTPINSSNDDFSFVNNLNQSKGYVASNRVGGVGSDDVYRFDQNRAIKNSAILNGNILDLLTQLQIDDATVTIQDNNGTILDTVRSDAKGAFNVELIDVETDFSIVAEKDGYIKKSETISFDPNKEEYNEEVHLMPVIDYYFAGLVMDNESKEPLSDVKVTIKDVSKNQLFTSLNNDVSGKFKTENLDYNYQDEVKYEFVFERKGYTSKILTYAQILAMDSELHVQTDLSIYLDKIKEGVNETTIIREGTNLADALMLNPIYFDLNSSYVRADAKIELDKIVKIMNESPSMEIELNAHTDCRETKKYNEWLSDRRAKRSAEYIMQRISNPNRVVSATGYGETRLKNDCGCEGTQVSDCSEEEHQKNRRTEFIVVKM